MGRCITAMRRWPLIKSRNRKLIRVTSSSECLKHMCVDLSDYNRYFNQIWHRTQIPYYQHAGMAKFIKNWESKMVAAAIVNFREMWITLDWIQISTPKFMGRCITAMRRWRADQKSKPEVKKNFFKFWWSQELDCLKAQAIDSNNLWQTAGRPRSGGRCYIL